MPARPTDGHAQGALPGAPPEPSGPAFIGPLESVFRYPMSFADFARIVVRDIYRRPARNRTLEIPPLHE